MTDDVQTFARVDDHTITIKDGGKDVRYVPESDLLTVKGASETARGEYEATVAKHQTTIAEGNRLHEETKQKLLQETAAKEQVTKRAGEADTLETKVGELQTSLNTADESRRTVEGELLERVRTTFTTQYKVDPEKVKDMDLSALREAEENLKLVGFSPTGDKPANYDGGAGAAGAGTPPRTQIEQANEELKIARSIQAKRRAGTNDPDYKP